MYKRASLRTGGSDTSGARRNTRKTTNLNVPISKGVRPHPLSNLRADWIPFVENCIRLNKQPKNLPPKLRREIEGIGGPRAWLKWMRGRG